jgi:hypothetical protein
MICEWIGCPDCRRSIVQVSGGKNGINRLQLLLHSDFEFGEQLTVGRLIQNWNKWIWIESKISTAKVCYGPVPAECFE